GRPAQPVSAKAIARLNSVGVDKVRSGLAMLETRGHGFVDQPVHRRATITGDFYRTTGERAVQRFVRLDLDADVGGQVGVAQVGAADDLTGTDLVFACNLEVHVSAGFDIVELAIGEACFNVGSR